MPSRLTFACFASARALAIALAGCTRARDKVSLFDGNLAFDLPAGFAPMSEAQAQKIYPSGEHPKHVYCDAQATSWLAISRVENFRMAPEQLGRFRDFMEQTLSRTVPGITWVKKDFLSLGGVSWARLEGESPSADLHDLVLIAPLEGHPVIFNFSATRQGFDAAEKKFTQGLSAIRLGQTK